MGRSRHVRVFNLWLQYVLGKTGVVAVIVVASVVHGTVPLIFKMLLSCPRRGSWETTGGAATATINSATASAVLRAML